MPFFADLTNSTQTFLSIFESVCLHSLGCRWFYIWWSYHSMKCISDSVPLLLFVIPTKVYAGFSTFGRSSPKILPALKQLWRTTYIQNQNCPSSHPCLLLQYLPLPTHPQMPDQWAGALRKLLGSTTLAWPACLRHTFCLAVVIPLFLSLLCLFKAFIS